MDTTWFDISQTAWSIAFMSISIIIPIMLVLFVLRLILGSTKKTVRRLVKR